MIYIYDILLNFCDNDLLYDFYEWDNNDDIENIKRIKLAHVNKDLLSDLLKYEGKIDTDFLLKIYRTCEIYTGKKVKIVDYCCLFSDGDRVVAIEFDKDGNSIYKSKLLLDEEDEISLLACNLELSNVSFRKGKLICDNRFFTRNELFVKNYLSREIEECYNSKNYVKLKYLYQEYFDKDEASFKKMKNDLLESMKNVIDFKHNELFKLLKLTTKSEKQV